MKKKGSLRRGKGRAFSCRLIHKGGCLLLKGFAPKPGATCFRRERKIWLNARGVSMRGRSLFQLRLSLLERKESRCKVRRRGTFWFKILKRGADPQLRGRIQRKGGRNEVNCIKGGGRGKACRFRYKFRGGVRGGGTRRHQVMKP